MNFAWSDSFIISISCIFKIRENYLIIFNKIMRRKLIIPAVIEKIKVKLALAIPASTPIILVNEIIDTPLLVALEKINILSM